jgi:hypothetical protein
MPHFPKEGPERGAKRTSLYAPLPTLLRSSRTRSNTGSPSTEDESKPFTFSITNAAGISVRRMLMYSLYRKCRRSLLAS